MSLCLVLRSRSSSVLYARASFLSGASRRWRLRAAKGGPRRCHSCAANAWPGLGMWMLKQRAGGVSGKLTPPWALYRVSRGLALSARTSRGVSSRPKVALTQGRRSTASLPLTLNCRPPASLCNCKVNSAPHEYDSTRTRKLQRARCVLAVLSVIDSS